MMDKYQSYIESIRKSYPELSIKTVEPDQIGQYNDVLLINGEFIFRFPRYEPGIEILAREAAILDSIKDQVPLAVPDFIYRSIDGKQLGTAFVGYHRIPGELLWGKTLKSIEDDETIHRVARQLAGFLYALHQIHAEDIPCDLPLSGTRQEWETLYSEFREHLFPHMRPDAQKWTEDHFGAYLDDPDMHEFDPCLCHGDFGPTNVLYNRQARAVCGVIDFGFSGLGDPAQDIAAATCFGDAFVQYYAEAYPGIEKLYPRAQFIKGTFALYEALHGVKNNNREAFESGIAQYI